VLPGIDPAFAIGYASRMGCIRFLRGRAQPVFGGYNAENILDRCGLHCGWRFGRYSPDYAEHPVRAEQHLFYELRGSARHL
jgi:hypothetical protein